MEPNNGKAQPSLLVSSSWESLHTPRL